MKILVIDDDRVVRETLTRVLEAGGHQVIAAADGRRGMQLFRDAAPDLVITDIMMPGQEGIETIRLMRGERPQARIVAISGDVPDAHFDILAIARQLGADDALRKPVRPAELLNLVRRIAGPEGTGLA
jgi:CheY-like chemotaxis protein